MRDDNIDIINVRTKKFLYKNNKYINYNYKLELFDNRREP